MEVNDLFFNQPARLKFLKSAKTEFSYIQEYVQALALSHPEIAFVLKNNGNEIISTSQNSDLFTRITQVYSGDIMKELREVNKTDILSEMKITGYVSLPSYTRSSKKAIYTFVNSRNIKCPVLIKAIDTAYNITDLKYTHQYINTDNIDYFEQNNDDVYTFDITPAQTIEETFELDGYGSYTVYARNSKGDRFLARLTVSDPSDMPQITLTKDE